MAATTKTEYLLQLIKRFDIEKRMEVKSLSRDMAQHYDWMGRQAFMNAYHVIDFHVAIMEQLQAVRIVTGNRNLVSAEKLRKTSKIIQRPFSPTVIRLQLLARSRGLLFLMPHQWNEQQKQRASILFERYPEIKKAYDLVMQIRRWFKPPIGKTTYQKTRNRKKQQLMLIIKEFIHKGLMNLKTSHS